MEVKAGETEGGLGGGGGGGGGGSCIEGVPVLSNEWARQERVGASTGPRKKLSA